MRKYLAAAALTIGVLTACQPTPPAPKPTVTATPSTTKPACRAVTTVTGKVTPKTAVNEVKLERQTTPGGPWTLWMWFENEDDGQGEIIATVSKTTGNYTLTYLAPNHLSQPTTRLRIHGKKFEGADVVSTSWYVTRPSGCT